MNLEKLSRVLLAERGSIAFKLPDSANIESSTELLKELKILINSLRRSKWPDKGFSFDLSDTQRLNSQWETVILETVKLISKKNIIGLDIWVKEKPTKQINNLISQIKTIIKRENSHSIRIRYDKQYKNSKKYLTLFTVCGISMIVSAEFLPMSEVTLWSAKFKSNFTQMAGVLVGLLPWVLPTILKLKFWKQKTERPINE